MSRPRLHSDDELLERISVGLQSASWTLADAARAADVHPATLIKRFGSRLGVLEALSRRWVAALPTTSVDEGGLAELRAWLNDHSPPRNQPAKVLSGLGMLFEDLQHDSLAELLRQGWARQRLYLASLVREATTRGELTAAPRPELAADLILTLVLGAQLQAAAERGNTETDDDPSPWLTLLEEWT